MQRSSQFHRWPGRLDNVSCPVVIPETSLTKEQSVAGGIPAGMTPLDAMVKECDEEASLPDELVRSRVRRVTGSSELERSR